MSAMSRQAKLTLEELHELKWFVGNVLSLLALWALSLLDFSGGPMLLFGGCLVVASLLVPKWLSLIPPWVKKFVAPLILLFVLIDFALNLPNFLPPLARMVTLLLLYRSLTTRRRREDLQLLLLSLFCLVISGALTISLLFAFQILVFAPLAMALLFVICLLDRGQESRTYIIDWKSVGWTRLIRRVWHALDFRLLVLGSSLFLGMVAVSSLLFVMLPRFNFEQAIPFLQIEGRSRVGFSGQVHLGAVTDIRQDNGVALRVDVPSRDAVTSSPYWRMMVLDAYSNGHFRMSPTLENLQSEFRTNQQIREIYGWGAWSPEIPNDKWTFYLEGGVSQYLPVPGSFTRMRFQSPQDVEWLPDLKLYATDTVKQSVFFYQLENLVMRNQFPASDLEIETFKSMNEPVLTGQQLYPQTLLTLTMNEAECAVLSQINEGLKAKVSDLNAVSFSQAATDFLRLGYSYSMQSSLPETKVDPVITWLSEGTRGHCEYFATAFILLAREAGFPARMVVGFAGGSWNSVEEYFVVRNNSAHAWAEIYDARTEQWLRVDPTPGGAPVVGDQSVFRQAELLVETGMLAWVDSLRIQWYRRIVDFDQDDQVQIAISIKQVAEEFFKAGTEKFKFWLSILKETVTEPFSARAMLRGGVIIGMVLGFYAIWWSRYAWLNLWHQLRRKPKMLSPVRQRAGRYLVKIRARSERSDLSDGLASIRYRLEAIRFGPDVNQSAAKAAFREARRVLRKRA